MIGPPGLDAEGEPDIGRDLTERDAAASHDLQEPTTDEDRPPGGGAAHGPSRRPIAGAALAIGRKLS